MWLIKNKLFRLGVFVVSFVAAIGLARSLVSLWYKRDIVGERAQILREEERKHRELEGRLVEATSSTFIERQAREKLGLVKDGEVVVLMEKPQVGGGQSNQQIVPNWKQWWSLFF